GGGGARFRVQRLDADARSTRQFRLPGRAESSSILTVAPASPRAVAGRSIALRPRAGRDSDRRSGSPSSEAAAPNNIRISEEPERDARLDRRIERRGRTEPASDDRRAFLWATGFASHLVAAVQISDARRAEGRAGIRPPFGGNLQQPAA